jgi:hypothetical protein
MQHFALDRHLYLDGGLGQMGGGNVDQTAAGPGTANRSWRRWLVLAVAIAVPLAGCGSIGFGSGDGDARKILADWRSFPVDDNPRPLVLTGPFILDPRELPGDYKETYQNGRVDLATPVPASPPTAGGYPVISAQAALDRFRQVYQVYDVENIEGDSPAPRLRIVAAVLGRASFETDRGPKALPAWRFSFDRVEAPAWVLAVDRKYLWRSTATEPELHAGVSSDGRSVTYHFTGSLVACVPDYAGDAVESRTAVVVRIREVTVDSSDGGCPAIGVRRTVTVRLADPLGARVLLTSAGSVVPVSGN